MFGNPFLTSDIVGGPVVFGWEGEVDPPIIHRHRHAAPRQVLPNPFPIFSGGRDPLGGMSNFPQSVNTGETTGTALRAGLVEEPRHDQDPRERTRQMIADINQRFARLLDEDRVTGIGIVSADDRLLEAVHATISHRQFNEHNSRPRIGPRTEAVNMSTQRQYRSSAFGLARLPRSPPRRRSSSDIRIEIGSDLANVAPIVPDTFRYRSHRPGQTPPRATDDGTNPLLQRGELRRPDTARASMGNWISTVGPPGAADVSSRGLRCPSL